MTTLHEEQTQNSLTGLETAAEVPSEGDKAVEMTEQQIHISTGNIKFTEFDSVEEVSRCVAIYEGLHEMKTFVSV